MADIEATTACYTSLRMGAAGSATKNAKPPAGTPGTFAMRLATLTG
jgi:hypothetical protein